MVYTKGGLGNQLFQYAFGRAVSKRLGTELVLDISFYSKSQNRHFVLQDFNIHATTKTESLFERLTRKLGSQKILRETQTDFDESFLRAQDSSVLEGHWHSERYFAEIRENIQRECTLKKGLSPQAREWEKKIENSNTVSVHIRRGDYLEEKHHSIYGTLPASYYTQAVELIGAKVTQPKLFVFSDDITWSKENMRFPYPTEFVSSPYISVSEELILMSRCKHNIIANSSFSWWGAWLNTNPQKIVIAPLKWFADSTKSTKDLIPKTWTQL